LRFNHYLFNIYTRWDLSLFFKEMNLLLKIQQAYIKWSETREEKYKQQWYQLVEEFNRYVKENRQI
jgi:hypothetical protein